MRKIGVSERRARLAVRHHLSGAARAAGVADVGRSLIGLHATDPASVYLGAWARLFEPDAAAMGREMYDERRVVRMLGMRRTMFVVPVELVSMVQRAATEALLPGERKRLAQMLEQCGITRDGVGWLREVEDATMRALEARGEALGSELAEDVPALRAQLVYAEGKNYGGPQNATTRVLFLLSAEGRIVRGRPRGTWTSSQHRWAPMASWLPGGPAELPIDAARAELVRCWLRAFGPGTETDIRWWTGWTLGEVRWALAALDTVGVELDGGPGVVLADDVDPVPEPEPWVALLPALDTTAMAWSQRDWYVGEHRERLFDRSGNIGPTIWSDGRIVGGWAQRRDGEIVHRFLEDTGAEVTRAVEAEAQRLAAWIGPVRVTPRFRTPLERELAG
jgi:Winged helix DNA-binding domain